MNDGSKAIYKFDALSMYPVNYIGSVSTTVTVAINQTLLSKTCHIMLISSHAFFIILPFLSRLLYKFKLKII